MSKILFRLLSLIIALMLVAACQWDATTSPTQRPLSTPAQSSTALPYTRPHPSLNDARVREAIADCTNKTELIKSVYPWYDQPATIEADSIVPQDHWAYAGNDPSFTRHPFNQSLGEALLDQAGWQYSASSAYRTNDRGEPLALKLTTTNAVFRQTWTAKFVEQMNACGILILPGYVPADWLFGQASGLQRRDFELAAYAWVLSPYFDIQSTYPCDQVPGPGNQWMGQNYNNWCDPQVNEAVPQAANNPHEASGQAAYALIQQKFSAQVPSLPLFQRLMVYATNPQLQNFLPDSAERYTWNAPEWQVPGKDTLTILQAAEPTSLLPTNGDYAASVIEALIYGLDYTALNYQYQPALMAGLPSVENGGVQVNVAQAKLGDTVVDADNRVAVLGPGVTVYNADDQVQAFNNSPIPLKQLTVTYTFKPNLTWSDGAGVLMDDYKLAYQLTCQPSSALPGYKELNYNCDKIADVNFLDDHSYAVTWKPGFVHPTFVLPPFGRLPDHLVLKDGRQLRDLHPLDWDQLPELNQTPLGVGPYQVAEWQAGKFIRLTANPYYAGPAPLTSTLIFKFVGSSDEALSMLKEGEADIIDPESFDATSFTPALLQAQQQGLAKVSLVPSNVYEHIDFNFNAP